MKTPYTATQQELESLLQHWYREWFAELAGAENPGVSCQTLDEASRHI
jgi:hypothetical protein